MSDLYRAKITRYILNGRRVPKGTRGAVRTVGYSKKWYSRVQDRSGTARRVPLCEDNADAHQMLGKLLKADRGELDYAALRPQLSIDENLADYERYLRNKENGKEHIRRQPARVRTVLVGCRCVTLAELDPLKVDDFLADKRASGDWSRRTSNHHLTAIKGFTRWLASCTSRRLSHDPLAGLSLVNVRIGRKLERRALDVDEFARFIRAARAGAELCGIPGPERALLYTLAAYAGLRRKECSLLTPLSFDLKAVHPTVTIKAADSKRKRVDVQPLRADLAALLKPLLATREPKQPVWGREWFTESAAMVRTDLAAAGVPYIDEHGRVFDFHALRHHFISHLVRGGVHPKLCQRLARHASITTTMDYYAHVQGADELSALATLPEIA